MDNDQDTHTTTVDEQDWRPIPKTPVAASLSPTSLGLSKEANIELLKK